MDTISADPRTPQSSSTGAPGTSRRSLLRTAAWTAPAVLVAASAPAFAASGDIDLGTFSLNGTCGVLGVLGPGFTLTADPNQALPTGTVITITGSGVANIGVFSVTGGTASVSVLAGTERQITLTSPLAAGATLQMRTTLSISVAFTLSAGVALPTDTPRPPARPRAL